MDYGANVNTVLLDLEECSPLLVYVLDNTDNGTDGTNRTLLLGVQSTLS